LTWSETSDFSCGFENPELTISGIAASFNLLALPRKQEIHFSFTPGFSPAIQLQTSISS
jgi:hypothetical protein